MPTSIQSFVTFIPRSQIHLDQNNVQSKKSFVRKLKIEEVEETSTSNLIPLQKNSKRRVKILIGLSICIPIIILCILLPIFIGKNQITTTTTTTSSPSISTVPNWNKTGTTAMGITGVAGTGANQLQRPFGLSWDSSYSLYIADAANHRVQKYLYNSSTGTTVAGLSNGTSGTGPNAFRFTSDVVVDNYGNIYVTDILNNRVQLSANGSSTGITVVGNGTAGTSTNLLNNPYGITYDLISNVLYVSDSMNNRVMRYTNGSSSGVVVAGGNGNGTGNTQLSRPAGLYYDSSTNSLIIANSGVNNIVRWIIGANSWTIVAGNLNGSSGMTSTELNFPSDVILDSYGNIYVADTNNHRIQFYFSGQSNGTAIAGITGILGTNATLLNYPRSVTLDYQQNLFVSDTENHRIQKFSL